MHLNRSLATAMIVVAAFVSARCSNVATPTSPVGPSTSISAAVGGDKASLQAVGGSVSSTATIGQIRVCKAGNVSGTFTVTGAAGPVSTLPNPTVAPGTCTVVAEDSTPGTDPASSGAFITITETSAGLQSISMVRIDGSSGTSTGSFTNGGTLFLNNYHGYAITFTNNVTPPVTGTQGCTPGYWKQDQHFDSWKIYSQGADFDATFGVNFFSPNLTLFEALGNGGGGVDALGRHAVAALLNAAAGSGVGYPYTTAQVIAIVRGTGAYSGQSVEARKNLLADANELGCPLN